MNHDFTQCTKYSNACQKTCFRAQLTADLKNRPDSFRLNFSYAYFKGTDEFPLTKEDKR